LQDQIGNEAQFLDEFGCICRFSQCKIEQIKRSCLENWEKDIMFDLLALFNTLQLPNVTSEPILRFSARSIPQYERYQIAKDPQGTPSLLISVTDMIKSEKLVPIRLENLSIQYDITCHILHSEGIIEDGRFIIIHCTGHDEILHIYFLHSISAIITSLGANPSHKDVADALKNLTTLFRAMDEKPQKSVQGLWAELFLIAYAHDINEAIEAWHITPEDRYDFSTGHQRVEAKSTSSHIRQHYFSLEQLSPPADATLLVASLFVEYAGAGTSVVRLVDQIHSRLRENSNLVLRVNQIISLTLGNNWRDALEARFDLELAEASLAFFDGSSIPTINRELPLGVSDVHFKSDLTHSAPLSVKDIQELGGLFQSILPQHRFKGKPDKLLPRKSI
jgi:hypothetical protein